jgi:hypothetical protein
MLIRLMTTGLAAIASAAATAQPPAEWVGQAPLPGLVIAYQLAGDGSLIVERVPRGESIQRWTRMVTNQRFAGEIAAGGTIDRWHAGFVQNLSVACPGFRASVPARLRIEGRPALEFRGDCPRNPSTGRPETFFLRVIGGRTDLHLAQIGFRSVPTPAEVTWARGHLATVTLCTRAIASPICRAGPEAVDR